VERAAAIISLRRNFLAVEVRKIRLALYEEASNPLAEPFAFEIGQVPHLLDRRPRAIRGGRSFPFRTQLAASVLQKRRHGRQRLEELLALTRTELHVLHEPSPRSAEAFALQELEARCRMKALHHGGTGGTASRFSCQRTELGRRQTMPRCGFVRGRDSEQ